MLLYVMRHGPAEDDAASGLDGDRGLTSKGRRRCIDVAKALIAASEIPDQIVSSPFVRAVQTAEIVAISAAAADLATGGNAPPREVTIRRELVPSSRGGAMDLVNELRGVGGAARLLLCGHEPQLSDLIDHLLGTPLGVPMDKAMVVALDLGSPRSTKQAHLVFVLEPKTQTFSPPR